MGNKSQKKTNNLLDQQRQAINTNAQTYGNRSGAEYDYRSGTRDYLTQQYKNLYEGKDAAGNPIESGGGGGGGGAPAWVDPSTGMRTDVYNRYQNLADTGGWDEGQKANYRSWTTAPIAGFYQGMKRDLDRHNRAIGGYAGYNSQSAKLGRDAARRGYETASESETNLEQMIREAKLQGIQGMAAEAEAISGASRPSGGGGGGGGGGSDSDKGDYYLRQLQGLMGGASDLQYGGLSNAAYGQGLQAINSRVDETPGWQKALTSIIPQAAGAAMGAFSGGGSVASRSKKRTPYNPDQGYTIG